MASYALGRSKGPEEGKVLSRRRTSRLTVLVSGFLMAAIAAAWPCLSYGALGPVISSVVVDSNAGTIQVSGQRLVRVVSHRETAPEVKLGTTALTLESYTESQLTAALPSGIEPGGYYLIVSTGDGTAGWNLTIGAVGPQGSAGPQGPQGPNGTTGPQGPQDHFGSAFSPSQLHLDDIKAGIFWGGGLMSVDRIVAPGPAPVSVLAGGGLGPAFPGFRNRTDTSLNDPFLAVEGGFRWGDMLVATTSVDTNIRLQNQFTQTSSATSGQTNFAGNPTLGVLFLPDNTKGVITLDERNTMWDLDQCFAFSVAPKLQLLFGWKYGSINSSLAPYSAQVPSNSFINLPGITGWQNFWTNTTVPSTTGFTMAQGLWWSGPFLGMRFTDGAPRKLPGQWYVEGKVVPYAFGSYEFEWNGSYRDSLGYVLNGQQSTHLGVHGFLPEVKSGTKIKLAGSLFLDVWAKYVYLNMHGSGAEEQSFQSNFTSVPALSQVAYQTIAVNSNFWGVGADLVLPF